MYTLRLTRIFRRIVQYSLFAGCVISADAQSVTKLSKDLEVGQLSGELFNVVAHELKLSGLNTSDNTKVVNNFLSDSSRRSFYLLTYEKDIQAASSKINDILLSVSKENLRQFGNECLDRFKYSSGGKNLDRLLAPVMSESIRDYAADTIDQYLQQHTAQLAMLSDIAISSLDKRGVKYKQLSIDQLKENIEKVIPQDISKGIDRILLNRLTENAYKIIKDGKENIIAKGSREITRQLNYEFTGLQTTLNNASKEYFANLAKGIKVLSDNEFVVSEQIGKIQNNIIATNVKISSVQKEISNLVLRVNGKLENLSPDQVKQLKEKQEAHALLLAQNMLQNSVVSSYLKDGIAIVDKVQSYEQMASKIFSGEALNNLKGQLEVLKKPTLSSVVTLASNTLETVQAFSNTLEKFGVKGVATNVGKFVKYANVALGLATSLIPPNPIGLIGCLGSLGGLFGGGGPSMEEQMMEAMQQGFQQMNERLDDIDKKLESIEVKLDKLTVFVQTMYKDVMTSLQFISGQLMVIQEKVDLNNEMSAYQIYYTMPLIENMVSTWKARAVNNTNDTMTLNFYNNWYDIDKGNNEQALRSLNSFITTKQNLLKIARSDFYEGSMIYQTHRKLAETERKAFDSTVILLSIKYPDLSRSQKLKNIFLIPAKHNDFMLLNDAWHLSPDAMHYDYEEVMSRYFNSDFIIKVTNHFVKLYPFFLLQNNQDASFRPITDLSFLLSKKGKTLLKGHLDASQVRFANLLEIVNDAIAQQVLLSGQGLMADIDNTLFQNGGNLQDVINVVNSNELLSKNLATYLISGKIPPSGIQRFSELYYEVQQDRSKLTEMNRLISEWSVGKLRFGYDEKASNDPLLYLFYADAGNGPAFKLPVPPPWVIEERSMIFSENLYQLMDCKKMLINQLLDIGFYENVPAERKELYKNFLLLSN